MIIPENNAGTKSLQPRRLSRCRRVLFIFMANGILLLLLCLAGELLLRGFTPRWLEFRMHFLAHGGDGEALGTDRAWKVVSRNGQFLSFAPGSSFTVSHAEYLHEAHIDELGGRVVRSSRERSLVKLLPCFGDSFTFGVGVADGLTFVDRLQHQLNRRLVNLGVPGTASPRARYLARERYAELGSPKEVLLFFFLGNDFDDIDDFYHNQSRAETVLNSVEGDTIVLEGGVDASGSSLSARINAYVSNSSLRHLYLLQYLKRSIFAATERDLPMAKRRQNPIFSIMSGDKAYEERITTCLDLEFAAWTELEREKGFRLIVVFVPDEHQITEERLAAQAEAYGIDPKDLNTQRPNLLLARILDVHNISYVDPLSAFQSRDSADLYYLHDNHFTQAGHRVFAETIQPSLVKLLEPKGAPASPAE